MPTNHRLPGNLARYLLSRALLAFILAAPSAFAGELRYPVREIPMGLRGDADAVVRDNSTVFEVRDRRRAREICTMAVTIFNPGGRRFGELELLYDRFHRIRSLEGGIYDEHGDLVRELEESDVHDYSAISGYSLYEDSRKRSADLYFDRYPYTVCYTYEIEYNGSLFWPSWTAQQGREPVQKTSFEVRLPEGQELRYWTNRDSVKPAVAPLEGKKVYRWSAENLRGLDPEVMYEDGDERAVHVGTAPAAFELDEYPGSMSSWKEFGAWNAALWAGRDRLPESAVRDVRGILAPGDLPREIIRKLYSYMQSRTRYVSVQLGIGGWQPFDASYVHEKGYGDCKALSNYMIALLKEGGVKAYPVLINRGERNDPVREGFPSSQFNHVIVCVPLAGDSVWLECTSEHMAPGHLDYSTDGRFGLMITPGGGEPVRTPASTPGQNVQRRNAVVGLAVAGGVQAAVDVRYTGEQCDVIREQLALTPAGEREKWLLDHVRVQNATLRSYDIQGLEGRDPFLSISTVIAVPQYGSVTGARCFFEPNILDRMTNVPPEMKARRSPVRFRYPYRDIDTIIYRISRVYGCEALPKEQHLECPAGSFRSKTVMQGDSLIVYTRYLEINGTAFLPGVYAEYRKFISDIVLADRAQVVLVRKKP